jgi:hypothetical protein
MTDERLLARLRGRGNKDTIAAANRIEALLNLNEALVELMDDRDAKLAKAVDWFETIRDRAKGDYMAHTYYLDALAALATIKRREPCPVKSATAPAQER